MEANTNGKDPKPEDAPQSLRDLGQLLGMLLGGGSHHIPVPTVLAVAADGYDRMLKTAEPEKLLATRQEMAADDAAIADALAGVDLSEAGLNWPDDRPLRLAMLHSYITYLESTSGRKADDERGSELVSMLIHMLRVTPLNRWTELVYCRNCGAFHAPEDLKDQIEADIKARNAKLEEAEKAKAETAPTAPPA